MSDGTNASAAVGRGSAVASLGGHTPRLIVFTDATVAPPDALVRRVHDLLACVTARSVLVVLRDKEMTARQRLELGRRLRSLCTSAGQLLGVADRLDLAALLGADAVHLGERSVSVQDARRLATPGTWITRACHDPVDAATPGADAVVLSPVVAARKGGAPLGVAGLARARQALFDAGRPETGLYALGGVDAFTAPACLSMGADGVAVIGAALDGRDVRPLVAALGISRG